METNNVIANEEQAIIFDTTSITDEEADSEDPESVNSSNLKRKRRSYSIDFKIKAISANAMGIDLVVGPLLRSRCGSIMLIKLNADNLFMSYLNN